MRCFPILGLTPSLGIFPSHWSHLCCASTASISPPSLDGMDISHQHVPPHVAHCISHRNGWSALLRCSSCPLDCSSQLGPTPHALDTIQAIQHIHTTLSAAPTRSRPCAAVHYGITACTRAILWRRYVLRGLADQFDQDKRRFYSVLVPKYGTREFACMPADLECDWQQVNDRVKAGY
jgi:hypothetical protein